MEKFSKQTWNSFEEFQDSLQQFCESNFHVLRVEDCRLIPQTDSLVKKFKYQYARFECVHGGSWRSSLGFAHKSQNLNEYLEFL